MDAAVYFKEGFNGKDISLFGTNSNFLTLSVEPLISNSRLEVWDTSTFLQSKTPIKKVQETQNFKSAKALQDGLHIAIILASLTDI